MPPLTKEYIQEESNTHLITSHKKNCALEGGVRHVLPQHGSKSKKDFKIWTRHNGNQNHRSKYNVLHWKTGPIHRPLWSAHITMMHILVKLLNSKKWRIKRTCSAPSVTYKTPIIVRRCYKRRLLKFSFQNFWSN